MTLYYVYTKGGQKVYVLENEDRKPVARFTDLYDAALVLRFLKGFTLNDRERNMAADALKGVVENDSCGNKKDA